MKNNGVCERGIAINKKNIFFAFNAVLL